MVRKIYGFRLFLNSSDELYAYLSHHRPDLCILEGGGGGGEEEEAERDEDGFVILSDGEEDEEENNRDGRAGDEWEVCERKWFIMCYIHSRKDVS